MFRKDDHEEVKSFLSRRTTDFRKGQVKDWTVYDTVETCSCSSPCGGVVTLRKTWKLETTEGEEVDLLAAFLELLLLFLLVVHLPSRQLQEAPVLVTGRVAFCNGQGLLDSL
jgi:hypothetical protein